MTRRLALLLFVLAASSQAQTFPAPGTGVFTWERVGDRPLDTVGFAFSPDGQLYAGWDTLQVLEPPSPSAPAGRWQAVGYPTGILESIFVLDEDSDTLFVAYRNGASILRSVTGGGTGSWSVVSGGVGGQIGGPDSPDGFFALPPEHPHSGRLLAGGTILRSDDRGASWTEATRIAPFPGDGGYAHVFAALPSGRVLAAGNWGVAASDDGGASVATTPIWGDFRFVVDGLAALATPGSTQTGTPACGLADPTLCDGAVAVGIDATAPSVRAWRTTDGGRSWSEPVLLLEPADGAAAAYVVGVVDLGLGADGLGRAITVLGRGVIYATDDGAQTWDVIGRLPVRLGGASHYPHLVRLGPDGHLWVSTTINGSTREWMYRSVEPAEAAFIVSGESLPVGEGVRLAVRPQPAFHRIVINVAASSPAADAVLVVYDALGREIARLHEGPLAREASFETETGSWAPGVYVVRLVHDGVVSSMNLIVAR